MNRTSDDTANPVANGDDIVFPDVDGDFYADPNEHGKGGEVRSMTIYRVYNIRNEVFNSNLQDSIAALQHIDGIAIELDEERICVTIP